ncbi:MAG TPA: GTPase ObgE, partial [Chitinivibrionales bacterium]
MFIDETIIEIKAGDGGNGCFAYAREKYKPQGKPSGGNGGNGGSIYIEGSPQMVTLQDIDYRKKFAAQRGAHGQGSNKYGKYGEDMVIAVPLGTMVYDATTDQLLFDCLKKGQRVCVAAGGRGGKGNASLVTRKNPVPECAHPGKPGESKKLRLVLKVLADVGLVGRPNAGKSTLLSKISKARPKIADYPFTTLEPNLGIVRIGEGYESFVVADIPGLIEGSHKGKGLGIKFLKHIERTRILAIIVPALSEDPKAEADMLLKELSQYSEVLAEKPKCFLFSKADLIPPDHSVKIPRGWIAFSSITGTGIKQTLDALKK